MRAAAAWSHEEIRRPRVGRLVPSVKQEAGGYVGALLLLLPVWLPSLLLVGGYSLAFLAPFAAAAWLLWHSPPRSAGAVVGASFGPEWLAIALATFGAWLSMFGTSDPERAFRVLLPMAYGAVTIVALRRAGVAVAVRLVLALLVSGTAVLAFGLAIAATGAVQPVVMFLYRFKAFFENPNQLALVLAVVWPISIALVLTAASVRSRLYSLAMLLMLTAALLFSGGKTGMVLALAGGCAVWLYHAARSGTAGRAFLALTLTLFAIALLIPVILLALSYASPITYEKLNSIITGGVTDYQSIRSRNVLWDESIRAGVLNPLTGTGAGTKVLGRSHSHNMILDYFRGMGVTGLIAAVLMLGTAIARTIGFAVKTLRQDAVSRRPDTLNLSFFVGASGYMLGNQISDSFSPSTAYIFWLVYVAAIITSSEPRKAVRASEGRAPLHWNLPDRQS
jgi:O-antigen ligase